VLTDRAPNVRSHRPTVPPHVDAAIAIALSKLAADRFATAGEFAEVLQGTRPLSRTAVRAGASRGSTSRRRWLPWGIAAAAVVSAGWFALGRERKDAGVPAEFELALPEAAQVRGPGGSGITLGISRDGSKIVYKHTEAGELYVRWLDNREPRLLRGTENAQDPTFSPDGKWILFASEGALKKVPVDGGVPITVVDTGAFAS
jgi:hypothetical protein